MSDTTEPVATIRDIMPKKTVTEALAFVARNLPAIGKDSMSPQNYAYRGIEQIVEVAGPMLAAEGVVIVPQVKVTSIEHSPGMKDGWTDTRVEVDWNIYGPDGSMIHGRTCGVGRDNSDKGANKAQTQAYKYLLLPLLYIGNKEDDAEAHRSSVDDDPRPPEPPAPKIDPKIVEVLDKLKALPTEVRAEVLKAMDLVQPKTGQLVEAILENGIGTVMALIEGTLLRHKEAAQ